MYLYVYVYHFRTAEIFRFVGKPFIGVCSTFVAFIAALFHFFVYLFTHALFPRLFDYIINLPQALRQALFNVFIVKNYDFCN